ELGSPDQFLEPGIDRCCKNEMVCARPDLVDPLRGEGLDGAGNRTSAAGHGERVGTETRQHRYQGAAHTSHPDDADGRPTQGTYCRCECRRNPGRLSEMLRKTSYACEQKHQRMFGHCGGIGPG